MNRKWMPEEDHMLRVYFSKGMNWLGWPEVLPGRSPHAIRDRAKRLLLTNENPDDNDAKSDQVYVLLNHGTAPSEIDWILGLREGAARRIVVERWAKDKEEAEWA